MIYREKAYASFVGELGATFWNGSSLLPVVQTTGGPLGCTFPTPFCFSLFTTRLFNIDMMDTAFHHREQLVTTQL